MGLAIAEVENKRQNRQNAVIDEAIVDFIIVVLRMRNYTYKLISARKIPISSQLSTDQCTYVFS